MKRINVLSNFARDNPDFSTVQEAIDYSESLQGQSGLVIPEADVLIVDTLHVNAEFTVLDFGFASGNRLEFRITAGSLCAEYKQCPAVPAGRAGGLEDEAVCLHFVVDADDYVWHPAQVLNPLLGQELKGFYELTNQIYLYFPETLIYLSTLTNADTGSRSLFWTEST
jgi:hypothetical protein